MSNTQQHPRALRWLGKAPRGATHPQLFALEDEAEVVVKFSQNPQGERVLANEFICSRFAALLGLPVPGAILVNVPDELLDGARVAGACPADFKGGVHLGVVRVRGAEPVPIGDIDRVVGVAANKQDWEALEIFDQLVKRDDKPEILTYRGLDEQLYFVSIDYGFTFGGTPDWDDRTLLDLDDPYLRYESADLCARQAGIIQKLRGLSANRLRSIIEELALPRFGVTMSLAGHLGRCLAARAKVLVEDYDRLCI